MPAIDSAQAHESKLYYELSHVYDLVFSNVFGPRIHRVIESLQLQPGTSVLEVGVGTGLSLDAYPRHCEVTGIDLAPEMLERAQAKIDENRWRNIHVQAMDALNMEFEDSSFDFTMAFHVISVVPDGRRLLEEMIRVTKPGGTIVIINHFRFRHPLLSAIDTMIEPITRRLGWHTLDLDETLAGSPLRIDRLYKSSPRSLFTILIGTNDKPA